MLTYKFTSTFYRVFKVNFKAIVCVSQVVIKGMIESKKGGVIINTSSQASTVIVSFSNMRKFFSGILLIFSKNN